MTSNDPATVQLDDAKSALRGLGIEPVHIVTVTIGPDKVTVVRERRNEKGHAFAAGDEKATTTTTIGIDGRPA